MSEELTTRKKLTLTFKKLQRDAARDGKPGPSIAAVAREAGVSNALIHNNYPDIAKDIRDASGRGPMQQLEKQRSLAQKAGDRAAELRSELADLKTQNRGLASENARLTLLVRSLETKVHNLESGVKTLPPSPGRRG